MISISKSMHRAVTAHYNSVIDGLTNGKRVRDWLAGQSFQVQYKYGVDLLREMGVRIGGRR